MRGIKENKEKILSFLCLRGASGNQGIFAPARVLEKHSSCRFLGFINRIGKSLEFFAIAQTAYAKNRDGSCFYLTKNFNF